MATPRTRRRLVVLIATGVALLTIALYRRRELTRNTEEFHARYG